MPSFARDEAREWTREHLRGCANVVMPSFSRDLSTINEAAIRHDVRREIELGFTGALLVAETATTPDEYIQFTQYAVDEAAGRLKFLYHASFNSLDENIEMGRRAAAAGVELCLLAYPPAFFPSSINDIYQYTRTFCESVDLGVVLFPVPFWGFERLHPASLQPSLVERLVEEISNIVAIKAEGGFPGIAGFTHLHRLVGDEVIVTMPVEDLGIPLKSLVDMQWMGTSNMEYFGNAVPRMFDLLERGEHDKAMDLFWSLHPARQANQAVMSISGSNFAHRYVWKYMAWLHGMNGGPLRMPTMRIVSTQMETMRLGLAKAELPFTDEPDAAFFEGRHPC